MRRILMAALCAILLLYHLPGRTQSVITTPPGGNGNPWAGNNSEILPDDTARVVLTIEDPAYVGMPIWASIRFLGAAENLQKELRYPFTANPFFMRNHTFEVMRDGMLLSPRKPVVTSGFASYGDTTAGSCAPSTTPSGRFPLHLCYRFDEPGAYCIRYVLQQNPGKEEQTTLTSNWVTIMVQPYSDAQRQQWQQTQLAHPPSDAGLLVGEYLPALLASPDRTVLPAFFAALHHPNLLVRSYALNSLSYFNAEFLNARRAGVRATLSIDGPAYVDMPIWASIKFEGKPTMLRENFRYPFSANPADTWKHAFEVSRNGVLLTPCKAPPGGEPGTRENYGGAYAPPTAPSGRLPLHLCYRFNMPGTYRVRYVLMPNTGHETGNGNASPLLTSNWVTLVVKPYSAEERRRWQQAQLAHPPADVGLLVGEYLPALLASPDATVLPAFTAVLRSQDAQVNDYTLHALTYFDDRIWRRVIFAELQQNGPTDKLTALLFGWQRRLTQDDAMALVNKFIPYLAGNNSQQAVGALQSLSCLRVQTARRAMVEVPRHIDAEVMAAMPHVLALDREAVHALTAYLDATKSDRAHELLWQLTGENSTRNHALLCLCALGDKRDLRRLGDEMLKADDASLPSALHQAYREAAIPYLQSGHQFAVNENVRTACEREFE